MNNRQRVAGQYVRERLPVNPVTGGPLGRGGAPASLTPRVLKQLQTAADIAAGQEPINNFPNAMPYLPRPSRALRVTALTALLGGGGVSPQVPILWPNSVHVVGIGFGCLEGTAAALAALSVAVKIEGSFDLFTDGQAAAFAHVGSLLATNGLAIAGYFGFYRYAEQGTVWNIQMKNESAATNATPTVQFYYVDPRDLVNSDDAG